MSGDGPATGGNGGADGGAPTCADRVCDRPADFWHYHPEPGGWRPLCDRHVLAVHPSVEIHAWLASGYLKPVELERPDGWPAVPDEDRAAAFRAEVDALLGWGAGDEP